MSAGEMIALATAFAVPTVAAIYFYGRLGGKVDQSAKDIEDNKIKCSDDIKDIKLEREKAIAELELKINGVDRWTRKHEEEANKYRLEFAEKTAALEKQIELSASSHAQMLRLIERVEKSIEKMEMGFAELSKKVMDVMIHQGWDRRTGG